MRHSPLRWAACLAASFALIGGAAAQSNTTPPPATRSMPQGPMPQGPMHQGPMNRGATAASPSGTAATMPHRGMPGADLSRECAPRAAGPGTPPAMQSPGFRSGMSQCTREADREQRAECVRQLWERSGGTAACM